MHSVQTPRRRLGTSSWDKDRAGGQGQRLSRGKPDIHTSRFKGYSEGYLKKTTACSGSQTIEWLCLPGKTWRRWLLLPTPSSFLPQDLWHCPCPLPETVLPNRHVADCPNVLLPGLPSKVTPRPVSPLFSCTIIFQYTPVLFSSLLLSLSALGLVSYCCFNKLPQT